MVTYPADIIELFTSERHQSQRAGSYFKGGVHAQSAARNRSRYEALQARIRVVRGLLLESRRRDCQEK